MIGEKIKLCRKRLKMTQELLAFKMGVTRQNISQWETGARGVPIDKLVPLKRALLVESVEELLDKPEKVKP